MKPSCSWGRPANLLGSFLFFLASFALGGSTEIRWSRSLLKVLLSTSRNVVSTQTLSTGGNMKRQSLLANGITLTLGIVLLIATAALSALGQRGTSTIR